MLLRELRIYGDVDSIQVNGFILNQGVNAIIIGGNLTGNINCLPRVNGGQSILDSISIGGNLCGSIAADYGYIGTVSVGGIIGCSGNAVSIGARDGITTISAAAIFANITSRSNGGTGPLHDVRTTNGSFSGSLDFQSFNTGASGPGIFITNGDLDADITSGTTFTSDMSNQLTITGNGSTNGRLLANRTLRISQGLFGSINIPAGGLRGQIIINANGSVDGSGNPTNPWGVATPTTARGTVTIGSTVLRNGDSNATPYYNVASSGFGGGAIGLAPFRLYAVDCLPPDNSSTPIALVNNRLPTTRPDIRIRFYGPLRVDQAVPNGRPVKVERRVDVSGQQPIWCDVTDAFSVTVVGREVVLDDLQNLVNGAYRVTPIITNDAANGFARLLCDQVNGNLIVGAGSQNVYEFALSGGSPGGGTCIADVDDGTFTGTQDGGVTIDDLLYYLDRFEAGVLAADVDDGSFCGVPDGGVTIDDLLYYLWRFEQGC